MTTRAAAAATSQRAKHKLVNLLYKSRLSGKGTDAHRGLDAASYTYTDLRNEYLKRVQLIHPDKVKKDGGVGIARGIEGLGENSITSLADTTAESATQTPPIKKSWYDDTENWEQVISSSSTATIHRSNTTKIDYQDQFIELQEAWETYDKFAKSMKRNKNDNEMRDVQEDFTLFGVGCSFSDSMYERDKRSEIMDQASKGWFPAGALSASGNSDDDDDDDDDRIIKESKEGVPITKKVSLIDDDLFVEQSDHNSSSTSNELKSTRKSLVDQLKKRTR